jgi:hypothetical protein
MHCRASPTSSAYLSTGAPPEKPQTNDDRSPAGHRTAQLKPDDPARRLSGRPPKWSRRSSWFEFMSTAKHPEVVGRARQLIAGDARSNAQTDCSVSAMRVLSSSRYWALQ